MALKKIIPIIFFIFLFIASAIAEKDTLVIEYEDTPEQIISPLNALYITIGMVWLTFTIFLFEWLLSKKRK